MRGTPLRLLAIGALLALTSPLGAICGGYGPPAPPPAPPQPAGAVPEDSREPADPKPPTREGPTTPGGGIGGPTTGGGEDVGGPTTGGGGADGPVTPGGGPGPGPTTGGGGIGGPATGGGTRPGRATRGGGPDLGLWTYWWYANRPLLLDDDMRVRRNAAARTGGDEIDARDLLWRADVRRALSAALDDEDDEIVAAAVLALGKGSDAADIPLIQRIAEDEERGAPEREHAVVALGLLGADTPEDHAAARRTLQAVASDEDASERLKALAILALGLRRDEAAVPFLADCARRGGRTWDVPAAGLTALGLSRCEAARAELERLLAPAQRGDETMRRVYAAHGLAKLGDAASVPALLTALTDDVKDVRRAAALALGAVAPLGDDTAVTALVEALEDDRDAGTRAMAAVSLGRLGGDLALAALRGAYDEDDRAVRPYAAVAIGLLARATERPRLCLPLLKDLRRGARHDLTGALCVGLGLSGLTDAAPSLRALVEDGGDPAVVAHAAFGLGLLGEREEAPEVLRDRLRKSNDSVLRGEIARALGMLGDMRTLVELDEMAERGSTEHERIVGCLGLGRVGGPECASLLIGVLSDAKRSRLERHMAGNALGLLLDPSEGRRTGSVAADLNWYALTPTVVDVLTEM